VYLFDSVHTVFKFKYQKIKLAKSHRFIDWLFK